MDSYSRRAKAPKKELPIPELIILRAGSGKITIVEYFARKYGFTPVAANDYFTKTNKDGTEMYNFAGKTFRKLMLNVSSEQKLF